MTKEYYELRDNRIDLEHWENIKTGLVIFDTKVWKLMEEAIDNGNVKKAEDYSNVHKSIEKTIKWLDSNKDYYPSTELEEEGMERLY